MAENLGYIPLLQEAIRKAHGCQSWHVKSERVKETFQGNAVWEGVVETFTLIGHPQAKVCYAWAHAAKDVGQEVRVVTVLGVSPIETPLIAVQASILADVKASKAAKMTQRKRRRPKQKTPESEGIKQMRLLTNSAKRLVRESKKILAEHRRVRDRENNPPRKSN